MPEVNRELPPLWALPDMFHDMSRKALGQGLRDALNIFDGRPIKVATMCSGTESPIFALELLAEALKSMECEFSFEHIFSAEIVPFKQAFIQRNFNPPTLFRDITQIKFGEQAETVFGAPKSPPPPEEVQILIAGFACVDFSNLNSEKRTFDFDPERGNRATGESAATFSAIARYARDFRPQIVIVENIVNAKWPLQVQAWQKIEYAAKFVLLDTKSYYLPQTRRRGYMICVNYETETSTLSEEEAYEGAERWVEIIKALSRPASSPIEKFLLKPNSSLLQCALAEVSNPTKPATPHEWELCKDRHRVYRQTEHLGRGNPFTSWVSGSLVLPAYVNKKWMALQPDRILDTLDVIKLFNARKDRDVEHKTHILDLSQNVDRGLDRVSPGLAGCVTPGGIPYSTILGRPLVGLEALALQGLPIERIHLTSETQKQLQDLAGNAMTTTVVGAALLAAFAALPQALKFEPTSKRNIEEVTQPPIQGQVEEISESCNEGNTPGISLKPWCQFGALKIMTVMQLVHLAGQTLQYCHCEGQHEISTAKMMKCKDCQTTVCKSCLGSPSHNLAPFTPSAPRAAPARFLKAIIHSLPTRLRVHIEPQLFAKTADVEGYGSYISVSLEDGLEDKLVGSLQDSLSEELRLRSWQRSTSWTITYSASRLSLTLQVDGSSAQWMLFAQPSESEPGNSSLRRVLNNPIARMRLENDAPDVLTGVWEICLPRTKQRVVCIKGRGERVPSWRNELELPQFREEKVWSKLVITGSAIGDKDPRMDIDGSWELLPLCGTANRALHCRDSETANSPENSFLVFLPSPYDDGSDTMAVTSNISRLPLGDHRDVYGFFRSMAPVDTSESRDKGQRKTKKKASDSSQVNSWKPTVIKKQDVLYEVLGEWVPCPSAIFSVPSSTDGIDQLNLLGRTTAVPLGPPDHCSNYTLQVLDFEFLWLDRNPIGASQPGTWFVTESNQHHISVDLKWLMSRIPFFSKGAVSPWTKFHIDRNGIQCSTCTPSRPEIRWKLKTSEARAARGHKCMAPYEDGAQAGAFEKAWKARPSPIILKISIATDKFGLARRGKVVISVNPKTLVHRVGATMPERIDAGPVKASWRLDVNYDPAMMPKVPDYSIPSNVSDEPYLFTFAGTAAVDHAPFYLRPEQARSLTWMLQRDNHLAPIYHEEVMEESPSTILSWKLEAKASRSRLVRGGVLADQVGYGKTVLIIALARATLHDSKMEVTRMSEESGTTGFPIPIKATCVITPPTLVAQWVCEVKRFWPNCKVIAINTPADLARCTIRDMKAAEIVILSASVLLHARHMGRLAELAGLPKPPRTQKSREFQGWLSTALGRLEKNISRLFQHGTSGFAEYLGALYEQYAGDWAAYNLTPSKRLRGEAFQQHRKAQLQSAPTKKAETKIVPTMQREISGFDVTSSEEVRGVVLNMFHFHRKVVDEQTYILGPAIQAISSLQSRSIWILSATPFLADFTDVQRLAGFLNVHLGVEDCTSSVTSARNAKAIRAEQTKVEMFEALQCDRTASWHRFRDQSAQKFLNMFARRNTVEHADIPMREHYIPVQLDTSHHLIYAVTQAQLLSGNQWTPKEIGLYASTGRHRFLEKLSALFHADTLEEALCQLANYNPWKDDGNPTSALDQMLQILEGTGELERQVYKELAKGVIDLKVRKGVIRADGIVKWSGISQPAETGGLGDRWVSNIVLGLCSVIRKPQRQLAAFEELIRQNPKAIRKSPWQAMQTSMRRRIGRVRAHAEAFVRARRLTRSLITATRLQRLMCDDHHLGAFRLDCGCYVHDTADLLLSTECGHTCCHCCYSSQESCAAGNCNAFPQDNCMVLPHQLANPMLPPSKHGAKMDAIVRIVQQTREDDRVLIFSQFEPVSSRISAALAANGIKHLSVREFGSSGQTMRKAQQDLEAFKANMPVDVIPIKALILNPADATAAGHNLTSASTVVFVSPLVADSDQAFFDAYTQAIGRARRFGQKHEVHVYHLVALQTFEVDVIEQRNKFKLRMEQQSDGEESLEVLSVKAPRENLFEEDHGYLGSWVYRSAGNPDHE